MARTVDRCKMLMRRYASALEVSHLQNYKIRQISLERYLVLIHLQDLYANQRHLIEIRTKYGAETAAYFYPENPPLIRFLTKMYHPNVSEQGSICVDFLTNASMWSMTYSFDIMITGILALLVDANCASPYNGDASLDWKQLTRENFGRKAAQYANNDIERIIADYCACMLGENPTLTPAIFDIPDAKLLEEIRGKTGDVAATAPTASTTVDATPATTTDASTTDVPKKKRWQARVAATTTSTAASTAASTSAASSAPTKGIPGLPQ